MIAFTFFNDFSCVNKNRKIKIMFIGQFLFSGKKDKKSAPQKYFAVKLIRVNYRIKKQ